MRGWILCVIPQIREDVFKNSKINHMKQVNTVINILFSGLSKKELHETLDTFWSEFIKFDHNNVPSDINEFIWSSKDIFMVIVICGIRNNLYHPPKSFVLYIAR